MRRTHGSTIGYYNNHCLLQHTVVTLTQDTYFIFENVVKLRLYVYASAGGLKTNQEKKKKKTCSTARTQGRPHYLSLALRSRTFQPPTATLPHTRGRCVIQDRSYLISRCLVAQFVQHVKKNLPRVCLNVSVELFSKGSGKHTRELGVCHQWIVRQENENNPRCGFHSNSLQAVRRRDT